MSSAGLRFGLGQHPGAGCARFGEFVLDLERRVLSRGGSAILLEPKVFDCLALLVSRPGQLITTERLHAELWPDVHVGPGALRKLINLARGALAAAGATRGLIRTRRGLGYEFTGTVERASAHAAGGLAPAPPAWPFVARARELAVLCQLLARDCGAVCYVVGEAGAGKSALLAELRKQTPASTRRWLSGQCQAAQGVPAFWPWRQLAVELREDRELGPLVHTWLERDRQLTRLLPELAGDQESAPRDGSADAETRFDRCATFVALLQRLSGVKPLSIAIEDLHWADDGSLLLFELAARATRTHPIFLCASYRPEEVSEGKLLSTLIGRTSGRDGVASVHLGALTVPELEALLREVRHPRAGAPAAEALQRLTGGNPLFVQQVVSHALATDTQLDLARPASLPHIVWQRVSLLPEATKRLLAQASVLGHELTWSLLLELSREPALREELAPALRAGILRVRADDHERLQFSHALVGDALYAGLSLQTRQDYHREAFRACRSMPPGPDRSGALASHAFLAGDALPAAQRLELCEGAGREAFAALALDRAAQHLGRAVQLLDEDDASLHAADLTVLWAKACWEADRPSDEVELAFLQGAERARRAGAASALAEAAIGYAIGNHESVMSVREISARPRAIVLLEEALQGLAASEVDQAYLLAQTLCWVCASAGDRGAALRAFELARQREPPDPDPFRRVLLLGSHCAAEPARAGELAPQIVEYSRDPRLTPRQRVEACLVAMLGGLSAGDLAGYERAGDELQALVDALPQPSRYGRLGERLSRYLIVPAAARVTVATIRGQFDVAQQGFVAALAQQERLGLTPTREGAECGFLMLMQLQGYRGLSQVLEPMAEESLRNSLAHAWHTSLARAQFALERNALSEAAEHYRVLSKSGFRPWHDGQLLPVKVETLVRSADVCSRIGAPGHAAALYGALLPLARAYATEGGLISLGSVSRPLGELAAQLGKWELAAQHFECALEMNQRMGHRPEQVRTQLGLARVLLELGRSREARALISAGRGEATALGMAPMVALAEQLVSA